MGTSIGAAPSDVVGDVAIPEEQLTDSLVADFDRLMGDAVEPPGRATPAERAETPAPAAADPASRATDAGKPATPAPETTPPGSAAAPALTPEAVADLQKGAEPFTYLVDGQPKPFEGLTVFKGEGATIAESALPRLSERLALADEYETRGRDLERLATVELKNAQGEVTQRLTGRDAIVHTRVNDARKGAVLGHLYSIVTDPAKLANLLMVNPDGSDTYVVNPTMKDALDARLENLGWRAEQQARAQFGELASQPDPQRVEQEVTTGIVQYIEAWGKDPTLQGLTDEDKRAAFDVARNFLRPANAAEVQANPALRGRYVLDEGLKRQLAHTAGIRRSAATVTTTVQRNEAENAERLRAAGLKGPAANAPPAPRRATRPAPTNDKEKGEAQDKWQQIDRALSMGIMPADLE